MPTTRSLQAVFESRMAALRPGSKLPDFARLPSGRYRSAETATLFAVWADAYALAKEESSTQIDQALFG